MKNNKSRQRLFYLDNLKSLLICIVIWHHVIIAFGGEGAFVIEAKTQASTTFQMAMTGLLAINQSYFMGAFFLISGYFSYLSLSKKGPRDFIRGKIKRLILPAVVYLLVVSPLLSAGIEIFYLKIPFQQVSLTFNIGPLWFLLALFIFDIILAICFKKEEAESERELPRVECFLGWIIIISAITWVIRIFYPIGVFIPILAFQPAHMPQYVLAYTVGTYLSKHNWLEQLSARFLSKLLWGGVVLILVMLAFVQGMVLTVGNLEMGFGGFNIYSFLYSTWEQFMFVFMTFGLIGFFKQYLNKTGKISSYMSRNAFGAYIAHSFVIAFTMVILTELATNLNHGIGFILITVIAIPLSFIVGSFIGPLLG